MANQPCPTSGRLWIARALELDCFGALASCIAAIIDVGVFTTEKADIRVETVGRWTKGMTVCNFEKMGGMHHFGGTASEQTDFRYTVAMKLDHAKFCDLIVDSLERLVRRKG
ncbi:hypothetical protein A8146_26670 [Mesorhizobium loti]|nr:hypothetical protein A8146_26670 [Mesorhizobium loti]